MKNICLGWALALLSINVVAQTHSEKISKEFTFEKKATTNAVVVANINGSIKVEGYCGDKILLEVNKYISAKTDNRLQKGKQQIKLGVIDLVDTLIFFVEGTESKFGKVNRKKHNATSTSKSYGYNGCCNDNCDKGCDCRLDFEYKMDFVLKVPAGVYLSISTINDGNIDIAHVTGAVEANNINGSIKLTDMESQAIASTINGNVDIEYASNPKKDCRFYTLNGDINASFQKGLAANMSFESFNGQFYTNIDKLESLPVEIEKQKDEKGMKFKVNDSRYKVGSGGAFLDFETFNGDVYLKEK
ncbi:MAG: hypothetical protein WKF87_05405 [Chryseolinea sp.]